MTTVQLVLHVVRSTLCTELYHSLIFSMSTEKVSLLGGNIILF